MRALLQSTSRVVMLKVFLSSDHITAATGKTVAITISKNGAAFANPNAGATNATEVASGWYKVTLDTTDTGTVGDLVVRGTSALCDDTEQVCEVIAPHATAAALDAVDNFIDTEIADILARLPAALVSGRMDSSVGAMAANVMTAAAAAADLTTELQSGLATAAALDAVDNFVDTEIGTIITAVAAIQAKTDNLPSDPADASVIAGRFDTLDTSVADLPTNAELATALGTADDAVLTQVALVKAKTDNLPSDPADASVIAGRFDTLDTSVADLPTNAELATALGTADDAVLAQVALVKAKTDNLPSDPADQSLVIAATDALATLIGDLPTNAELATALGTADDSVLTQVGLVKAKTDLIPGTQDGLTFAQTQMLVAAALLGKASGMGTTTAVFRSADDGEDRITATVDADGNRSAVTLNTV